MADKKEKKYLIDNPILMAEWDWEENNKIGLNPNLLSCGSIKKAFWVCKKGHKWYSNISDRNRGSECPYCSNNKILKGYNDLATINPKLAKEWNYEKNNGLKPNMVTAGSNKRVWWKCEKGHEWLAYIKTRNNGSGCPYCAGQRAISGYNDIATINPKLAIEWNYKRNGDLKPEDFTANSGKKVWWRCAKGHEWQATVNDRSNGYGCPYCSGRYAIKGENDLGTINPKLAREWNYERNGNLKPEDFTVGSRQKVWWKCDKGHEWQATIADRNIGTNCPICSKELQTSFPEQSIYFYIKKLFPDAINGDKHLGMEFDIFIPSINIAIEYDGIFWHKNKKALDERKNRLCNENNILLIRVREDRKCDWIENDYLKIITCGNSDDGLKNALELLMSFLNRKIDIDLSRDRSDIYSLFINNQKIKSLLNLNPQLAEEWNYDKNGKLKPDMVTANSHKKVWWKCKNGHEWQAVIAYRNQGAGCPYCSGRYAIKGKNDLVTINPKLASEWNYEKNEGLKPEDFTANSGKKVWWRCSKGHEWQATIDKRNKGSGCPHCYKERRK